MQPAIMPHRLELTPVESALERIWFRLDKPMTEPSMSLTTPYRPHNTLAKIIRGEAPCYKLYDDEDVLAVLDLFPHSFGHTLVILWRSAACRLLDVDPEALCKVMRVVQ